MTAPLFAVPPAEKLVRLRAPEFPSLAKILANFIDGNYRDLEWFLVRIMLERLGPLFAHLRGAKTLRQWIAEIAPEVTIKEPPTSQDLNLETRALRITHPSLPRDRHYFLLEGDPEHPITFFDPGAVSPDGSHTFRRWHIAALNVDKLFPPKIVRLVHYTLSIALISTEAYVMYDVEQAFRDFGKELGALFDARGMKW